MSQALYKRAQTMLSERVVWENKQRTYYLMRYEGLRRRNKPFPTAADLHFPHIDMAIKKWKPFWFAQVFNNEHLAQFVSLSREAGDTAHLVSEWFDYQINQFSNFEDEFHPLNDTMNMRGRGVLKVVWNPMENRLEFVAVDPVYILIPKTANDFCDAEEFVHVRHEHVAAYRRNPAYNQDEQLIAAIRGGKDDLHDHEEERNMREGITWTQDENIIVIFEHWRKNKEGRWGFHTYSPLKPEVPLRTGAPFVLCGYQWQGKDSLPFFSFVVEETSKGWYAPRGLAELLAPFQSYLTRLWNEKADSMSFLNRPLFSAPPGSQVNVANVQFRPGEVVLGRVQPMQMPTPPFSFDAGLGQPRGISEQLVLVPDYGIANDDKKNPRTAREIGFIEAISSVGVEMNGRMMRRRLAKLYQHCYAVLRQNRGKELSFFAQSELQDLPEQALHEQYMIQPDGSADQWNKPQRFARALARYQNLQGHPNVDQGELAKGLIAADDPREVRTLYLPGDTAQADEMENEAMELQILQDGYPAVAKPSENHQVRLQVLVGWIEKQGMVSAPVDPLAMQRVSEHIAQHMEFLRQQNPQVARQIEQAMQMMMQPQQPQPMQPGNEMNPATLTPTGVAA